jgi:hypothetical protein
MTTLTLFQPSVGSVFSFQPTLDGQQYIVSVPWGLAGQRWYISCTELNGTSVFYKALTGSPSGVDIESILWSLGVVTIVTSEAHGYKIGRTVSLSISGCSPAAYNGQFDCNIIDPMTFSYALASNPGSATALGIANYDINLAQGYFTTSTLVFREASQTFEVNP